MTRAKIDNWPEKKGAISRKDRDLTRRTALIRTVDEYLWQSTGTNSNRPTALDVLRTEDAIVLVTEEHTHPSTFR